MINGLEIPETVPSPDDIRQIVKLNSDMAPTVAGFRINKPVPKQQTTMSPDLEKLLDSFQDVFPESLPHGLPPSRPTDHKIEIIPGSKPPGHRVYRMTQAEEAELKTQLASYLELGHIRPAQSPYGAGVLFATKKGGEKRLCIDYRGLNTTTVKDVYPLPRIDVCIDEMRGAKIFSKIDLRSAFNQIRVHPEHIHRTAFNTKFGSYEFLVMPFGLCNAPSTFQRTIDLVLSPLKPRTLAQHTEHIRQAAN